MKYRIVPNWLFNYSLQRKTLFWWAHVKNSDSYTSLVQVVATTRGTLVNERKD